jgi:hypothetical protein
MPGPVSDSYDPEWGTASNADEIKEALDELYIRLDIVLGNSKPMFIIDLVRADLSSLIQAVLTEHDWRLLRFAVERAKDSIL